MELSRYRILDHACYKGVHSQKIAVERESDGRLNLVNITVHRIAANMDFRLPDGTLITQGTLGGMVESYANLCQSTESRAWIAYDAYVCGSASVEEDAQVCDRAMVAAAGVPIYGIDEPLLTINGRATIRNGAKVTGTGRIGDDVAVGGAARVSGYSVLEGHAVVLGEVIDGYAGGDTVVKHGEVLDALSRLVAQVDFSGVANQLSEAFSPTRKPRG